MDDLEQFLSGGTAAAPAAAAPTRSTSQPKQSESTIIKRTMGVLPAIDSDYLNSEISKTQKDLPNIKNPQDLANAQTYLADLQQRLGASGPATRSISAPAPAMAPSLAAPSGDSLEAFLSGASAPGAQPQASAPALAAAPAAAAPAEQPSKVAGLIQDYLGPAMRAKEALKEGMKGGAVNLLDTTLGAIVPTIAGVGNLVASTVGRAVGVPEGNAGLTPFAGLQSFSEKPFAKAFGMTQAPSYKTAPSQQAMDFIGKNIELGVDKLAEKTGMSKTDVANAISTLGFAVPAVAGAILKPVVAGAGAISRKVGEYKAAVEPAMADTMQAQLQAKQAAAGGKQSAGAAAVTDQAAFNETLSRASPELQTVIKERQAAAGRAPNAQDVKALENQVKAEQFGIQLTEGQATGNLQKLSEEYNSVKQNPEMGQRIAERNPKLVEGFTKIKERVAPDVYESDPVRTSNIALEKLKADDVARQADVTAKYKALTDANGGNYPINGEKFVSNVKQELSKALRTEDLTPSVQSKLDQFAAGRPMTFENFETLRSDLADIQRSAKDGRERSAAAIVRRVLESQELPPEAAALKPLADVARKAAKDRFTLIEQNPAIKAAINDTRTPAEIARGDLHPGANGFLDKFYGTKTPEVNVKRLIEQLGQGSEAHQGLNAAVVDRIAKASGVKGGANDAVSQAALNKQVKTEHKTNLKTMMGNEGAQLLNDIADVAATTEHVRPGGYANVSKTAIAQEKSPMLEAAKTQALNAIQVALTAANPAAGVGMGLARTGLKGRAEKKAAAEATRLQDIANKKPLEPGAGTFMSDIGKK